MKDMTIEEFIEKYDVADYNKGVHKYLTGLWRGHKMMSDAWRIAVLYSSNDDCLYMLSKADPAAAEEMQKRLNSLDPIRDAIRTVGAEFGADRQEFEAAIFSPTLEKINAFILSVIPDPFGDVNDEEETNNED